LAAAKQAGTRRLVVQSFGGWPFARTGGPVKTEKDPLDPDPPKQLRRTLDAIRYLESKTTGAFEGEGIVLRYGAFYGPGTGMLDRSMIDQLRRRRVPLIGDANGWWSFLHIDDAAAATAIAIERDAAGIYNIVDDEPAPVREWLPALAAIVGVDRVTAEKGYAGLRKLRTNRRPSPVDSACQVSFRRPRNGDRARTGRWQQTW
jgi:nucleoside-diphosphate-sugar epimerase